MEKIKAVESDRCISCGREVPKGRMICKCCEKCNGYSAARWLAEHIQAGKNEITKADSREY